MSKVYEQFKQKTINAMDTINEASRLKAVNDEYARGFADAMWEAREIYMRVEDDNAPSVEG